MACVAGPAPSRPTPSRLVPNRTASARCSIRHAAPAATLEKYQSVYISTTDLRYTSDRAPRIRGVPRPDVLTPSTLVVVSVASAYVLSVVDLVDHPGDMRVCVIDAPPRETLEVGLVAVPDTLPMHVDVRLESVHEGVLATGAVSARALGECGRCLEPVDLPITVEFQELFAYDPGDQVEALVRGGRVDLEPAVRDAVVLALPFQPVCRADCPGLDSITGERLADVSTSLPAPVTDPRWAILADIRSIRDAHPGDESSAASES